MFLWFVLKAMECRLISFMISSTMTSCALKMFRNSVVLEKDSEQVNFIKMRIQGIWDCPDQDQEVGSKHINETERFQLAFREALEPIDEDVGDLVDSEDLLESKQILNSTVCMENANEDNLQQPTGSEEPVVPDLLIH